MAINIREYLLEQANKFHRWQEAAYPGKTAEEIGGAWEVDYPYWNDAYAAFCNVLTQIDTASADSVLSNEMLYLIARDNEGESFIYETTLHTSWFEYLCRLAVSSDENEAKWQIAAYLPECKCGQDTKDLILNFAMDTNEYVSRRALIAMPDLRPDSVEEFAALFWKIGTVMHPSCGNTSVSPYYRRLMPFIPACCRDTWNSQNKMNKAICLTTQNR